MVSAGNLRSLCLWVPHTRLPNNGVSDSACGSESVSSFSPRSSVAQKLSYVCYSGGASLGWNTSLKGEGVGGVGGVR